VGGERNVGVFADRVVSLVVDDELHVGELIPSRGEVVHHDLGGSEHHIRAFPRSLSNRPAHRSGKPCRPKRCQPSGERVRVLLDERAGRSEEQHLSVRPAQDLRGNESRDDCFPEAGRKHDEEVLVKPDSREVELERQRAELSALQQRMNDVSVGHLPCPREARRVGSTHQRLRGRGPHPAGKVIEQSLPGHASLPRMGRNPRA
jgi:hypothetical protein